MEKTGKKGDAFEVFASSDWSGGALADALTRTLDLPGVRDFKNYVCYAMLAICVDDWNALEAYIGRGATEAQYQAKRASWREKRRSDARTQKLYDRCAAAYRRGLSPNVCADEKTDPIFPGDWPENVERNVEASEGGATAIFGRFGVLKTNLPSGLDATRRYYVGAELTNVEGGGVSSAQEPRQFNRSWRTLRVKDETSAAGESAEDAKPTRTELADGWVDGMRQVVSKLGLVDAFGRPCACDYQMPIFLGDKYFGWARVGFSKRPKPEMLATFWNAIYRLAAEFYGDRRRIAGARRSFQAKRERLRLTQELVEGNAEQKKRVELYADLVRTALQEPLCAKYLPTLCFLETTVPDLGDGGTRMTIDFNAQGVEGNEVERDWREVERDWWNKNRGDIITIGMTRAFQKGFVGDDDWAASLIELPKEPQRGDEREQKTIDRVYEHFRVRERFPEGLPSATARVVENRYGGERGERYFVATRCDAALKTLESSEKPKEASGLDLASKFESCIDETSHRQEIVDVSPAYGLWTMFLEIDETKKRDLSGRAASTIVGIPFVFDDATYRVFACFSTDGSNEMVVEKPDGEKELVTFDPNYFDDFAEAFRSVMWELRLFQNSAERARLQGVARNAQAAYQEGHSAAKRHASAKLLADYAMSLSENIGKICREKGLITKEEYETVQNGQTIPDDDDWDALYEGQSATIGCDWGALREVLTKIARMNARLKELSMIRDAVGRALDSPEKPETTFLFQKQTWCCDNDLKLENLFSSALNEANELECREDGGDEVAKLTLEFNGNDDKARLAPWISDGQKKWRPADFFYVAPLSELLFNARKRGKEKIVYVSIEEIGGELAIVLSNVAENEKKISSDWNAVADLDFTGGLREKNAQLFLTNAGRLCVCYDDNKFKVAVFLKGLSINN